MIKSMTGFASLTREDAAATVSVTIKSVNHRFLDLQLRLPSMLQHLEGALRARVQAVVARGRVEVAVSMQLRHTASYAVDVNESVVAALYSATAPMREAGIVTGQLTLGDLLRIPQAIAVREEAAGSATAEGGTVADALVVATVSEALEALDVMRTTEGDLLRVDLDQRCAGLAAIVERIVEESKTAQGTLQARLQERVSGLNIDPAGDPAALAAEIVRFVARSDIEEEIVRFRSHVSHWKALAESAEPCGRKLDFLIQEMNREINTMGSKAEGPSVPAHVVTAKAELERLREQVQNVE
ncbi:MAG TPA: YicC/YloC family endoribonuclease [Vicinamibacterales bacterium]|nr:YicC/YloC family endoribonuclease [Vicinamibacterales bacterium]